MSVPLSTQQFELKDHPIRSMPVRKVAVRKMVSTQATYNPEKVASMARKDPASFDKVPVVGKFGGEYFVLDGHHRVAAALQREDNTLQVRIAR